MLSWSLQRLELFCNLLKPMSSLSRYNSEGFEVNHSTRIPRETLPIPTSRPRSAIYRIGQAQALEGPDGDSPDARNMRHMNVEQRQNERTRSSGPDSLKSALHGRPSTLESRRASELLPPTLAMQTRITPASHPMVCDPSFSLVLAQSITAAPS